LESAHARFYNTNMTAISPPATKADVEEIVGRVVGEIIGDAMQLISERFDRIDQRFAAMDKRFDKVEDKLDVSIAQVDHHSIDIRELQRKTA